LRCNITFVGNGDTVGKCVEIAGRIRLLRQILGNDFNLEFVVWHRGDFEPIIGHGSIK
jgi:hypothetical protein